MQGTGQISIKFGLSSTVVSLYKQRCHDSKMHSIDMGSG